MRKQLTAEQQQKRDARRAKLRALTKQVGDMSEAERAAFAARLPGFVTVEGRSLSPVNSMLLALQMPHASIVGGFRQWIKNGRAVRKGEHGAAIWVPIGRKEKNEETGEQITGEKTGFILGTVFDVSQTDEIAVTAADTLDRAGLVESAHNAFELAA